MLMGDELTVTLSELVMSEGCSGVMRPASGVAVGAARGSAWELNKLGRVRTEIVKVCTNRYEMMV